MLRAIITITCGVGILSAQSVPAKRMPDGKEWMIRNLDTPTTPSYCYDNSDAKCRQYGRLYNWESAQRACAALGNNWRLPSDDDWRQLAKHYGGVSADSEDRGKAAYNALLTGGSSGFNALLGGGREENGKSERLEAHGFYWTITEIDRATAWCYNFGKGGNALHRQSGIEKQSPLSVRCVRN